MIKDWSKFLESHQDDESQKRDFADFKRKLADFIEESDYGLPQQFYRSYSYTAQANKGNLDPEKDFQIVNNWMSENGWPLDRAEKFAKNWIGNNTFSDECISKNVSQCAPIDYYLYKITQGEFPLQGFEWSFFGDHEWEREEFEIRFRYGWHLTRYGRMCIEQNTTLKDYFGKITDDSGFTGLITNFTERYIDNPGPFVKDHFFTQDDECYLDIESFSKWIISETSLDLDQKDITKNLIDFFEKMGFGVRVIGQDIVIKYIN